MDGHSVPYYDFSTVEGMQKWQQDMLNMLHTNQTQFGNPMMVFNQVQMGSSEANAGSSNSSYPTSIANPMMAFKANAGSSNSSYPTSITNPMMEFNLPQMASSQANAGSSNSSYPASIGNHMMPFIQPQMPFKMVSKYACEAYMHWIKW